MNAGSWPRLVLGTAGVAGAALVLAVLAGTFEGWSWRRTYATFDRWTFVLGAVCFLVGVLGSKPRPPVDGVPEEEAPALGPEPRDPVLSDLARRREERLGTSEIEALDRLRGRGPTLVVAGLLLLAWTAILHPLRDALGRLYR